MGFSLELGVNLFNNRGVDNRWFFDDMEVINNVLIENDIHPHQEIKNPLYEPIMASNGYHSYSSFRRLKELYAESIGSNINHEMEILKSHLICHADNSGYYIPVAFENVIKSERIPGLYLGSSYSLKEELDRVSASIGIDTYDGSTNGYSVEVSSDWSVGNDILKSVWFSFNEYASTSIAMQTCIFIV